MRIIISQARTIQSWKALRINYSNRDYWITFDCPEFTSLCPVTSQPDFGHITIKYVADKRCVEVSLLRCTFTLTKPQHISRRSCQSYFDRFS